MINISIDVTEAGMRGTWRKDEYSEIKESCNQCRIICFLLLANTFEWKIRISTSIDVQVIKKKIDIKQTEFIYNHIKQIVQFRERTSFEVETDTPYDIIKLILK